MRSFSAVTEEGGVKRRKCFCFDFFPSPCFSGVAGTDLSAWLEKNFCFPEKIKQTTKQVTLTEFDQVQKCILVRMVSESESSGVTWT